jgi:putative oxidoreductase
MRANPERRCARARDGTLREVHRDMATTTTAFPAHLHISDEEPHRLVSHRVTRYLVPLGRCLFAAIFLLSMPMHFSSQGIAYAASEGVPLASLLVPASGVLALLGGASVALGYQARFGAFLLALFLVPVTLLMHDYWNVVDPAQAMIQQAMFWKNVGLLGSALILTHFGAGPISFDALTYKARAEELGVVAPKLPAI